MRRQEISQPLLPTGYRQLEYLESTGTQYINTGVNADTNTEVDVTVAWKRIFNDNAVVSMDAGSYMTDAFTLEYSSPTGGIVMTFGSVDAAVFPVSRVIPLVDNFYSITATKSGLVINGILYPFKGIYNPFSCSYPLFVFCYGRRGTSALNAHIKISSLKISNDGNIQRNYVPALRISDVKPGLYDTVNNQFYTNAGTGEFLYA